MEKKMDKQTSTDLLGERHPPLPPLLGGNLVLLNFMGKTRPFAPLFRGELFLVFVVFLFLTVGCSAEEENVFDRELNYQSVSTQTVSQFDQIYQPNVLQIIGDRLFISEQTGTPSFHILNIGENGELVYERGEGREGQGPGEFTRLMEIIDADSLIYIYDGGQFKLAGYDLQGNRLPEIEESLQTEGLPNSMFTVSEDRIVASGTFFHNRFQMFSMEGEPLGGYGELIELDEEFPPSANAIAWLSRAAMHPDREALYLFSHFAEYIEKYSLEGDLLIEVRGSNFPVPKVRLDNGHPIDDGGIIAYLKADSNRDYIYALYSGAPRTRTSEESINPLYSNKIHKFDFDLNLINAYELDHRTLSFTVDDEGGIYTTMTTEDEVEIRYTVLDNSM